MSLVVFNGIKEILENLQWTQGMMSQRGSLPRLNQDRVIPIFNSFLAMEL